MADLGNDQLAGAFAKFSDEVAPIVRVAGVARTREIVRTRKRNHAIALGVLVTLVIAIPAAALAAIRDDSPRPAPRPAASVTVSPAPSTAPSVAPSSPPASTVAPDGAISMSTLRKATLNLPGWAPDARVRNCPSGPVKFTDGAHFVADSLHIWVEKAVYADVDHDGADETVVRFSCGDQASTYQVVAFDRDKNGKIRMLGQVATQTGEVTDICDIRVGADESIEVQVLDYQQPLHCLEYKNQKGRWVTEQWRGYGWDGSAFVQNGGPRSFPANRYRTDLAASSSDLAMVRGADGRYKGTVTFTVRNKGTVAVPYRILVDAPSNVIPAAKAGCTTETIDPQLTGVSTSCSGPKVAPGGTAKLTLTYTSTIKVKMDLIPNVGVKVDDGYGDPVRENNIAEFKITY